MSYYVESIGAEFSSKAIENLGKQFTRRARDGYRLHSVFKVYETGCLGIGGGWTYLAIYIKATSEPSR